MTQQLLTRAVLDANVLAPGYLGAVSTSAQLIQLWRQNADELVMSEHLLGEVVRTYTDRYFRRRIDAAESARIVALLRAQAFFTEITITVTGVATEPKDDLVLATGLSAGASHLATRGKQLLKLESHQGLHIVPPGHRLALLRREGLFDHNGSWIPMPVRLSINRFRSGCHLRLWLHPMSTPFDTPVQPRYPFESVAFGVR